VGEGTLCPLTLNHRVGGSSPSPPTFWPEELSIKVSAIGLSRTFDF